MSHADDREGGVREHRMSTQVIRFGAVVLYTFLMVLLCSDRFTSIFLRPTVGYSKECSKALNRDKINCYNEGKYDRCFFVLFMIHLYMCVVCLFVC